jgi:ferrochelatase
MTRPSPAILLAQLGTPAAPTAKALRPYLRQFLGDPRVIEANRIVWWFVLNAIVLPRRPRRSAALYRRIWTDRGSPLLLFSKAQVEGLQAALGDAARVELGMRYGEPSIASAMSSLLACGIDRILVFPMFPQYSGATTASIYDAVFEHLRGVRVVPALRFVPPYHAHPAYIGALTAIVREELGRLPWKPDRILITFHGIPRRYIDKGDVYRKHSEETARLLATALDLAPGEYEVSFQSRFGREEWLTPYTEEKLAEFPRNGVKRVVAICPGFTADCLETLDEIGNEGKRIFLEAGGEDLKLLPCLNAHPAWIEGMATIAREELQGWK